MKWLALLLLLTSCAVYEPLPGLCYTDKTGTYICEKEEPEKPKSKWEECRPWLDFEGEVWANCMLKEYGGVLA